MKSIRDALGKQAVSCVTCNTEFKCDPSYINDPKCPNCLSKERKKVSPTQMKQSLAAYQEETTASGSTRYQIPIQISSEKQIMGALAGNASEAQKMGAPWMLTEFVENGSDAIKQNRKPTSEGGNDHSGIGKVILEIDETDLEVRVIDNGTGILDPIWIVENPFQSMKSGIEYLVGNFGRGLTGFRGLCENLDYITLRKQYLSTSLENKLGKKELCAKVSFDKTPKGYYEGIKEKEFKKYTKNTTGTVAILSNWLPGQWDRLLKNKHHLMQRMQLHFGHATKPDNFELIIRTISNKGITDEKIEIPDFSNLQPLYVKNHQIYGHLRKAIVGNINFHLYKSTPSESRNFKEPYLLINNRPLQDSKVCELEPLKDESVWSSKYITGYVECDFLHPNQLRNAIDLDANERVFMRNMLALSKEIEKELSDYIRALNEQGKDKEFKEIRDTFQNYIQKNNIKWNVTAFKMSGKLSQGSSGKLAPQGKISAKEGGVNEGLIAEDGTELAVISKQIKKTGPKGPPTGVAVVIKDPKSKNGEIPMKNGHSQKVVYVNPLKKSRGGVKKKKAITGPNYVPQKHEKIPRLSWYEPSIKAIVVNTGHDVYKKLDVVKQAGGFTQKMKAYLMGQYAWNFFMEFGEIKGDNETEQFKNKSYNYFKTVQGLS